MRALTATRALARTADRHALERRVTAEVARRVQFMQSYETPNELPLQTYQQYAMNAYGALGFTGNAVVFGAIDKRMRAFSEISFKYRRLSDKSISGDTSLAKLETPWPGGTTQDLLIRMEQDVSLAGNAFIRDTGDGVERLRPDWVTIISEITADLLGHQVRRVIGYYYCPTQDVERSDEVYLVDEVAHWAPTPDPLAYFRGMSWITPVIREINGDIRMAEYREAYFRNAATPNLVIRYEDRIAADRVERLQRRLRERHTGVDGAFGTLILDEGADLTVVGQDMQGSAFDALQAAGETRILMAAGIPPVVAGAREGLQASQIGEYQVGLRSFFDITIRPNWRGACGKLGKLVDVPPGSQLWYDASDVSALQQGEQDMAATMGAQASTANTLIMAGYDPDSVSAAIVAGDFSLLKHSGLVSVQMQSLEDKHLPAEPPPGGVGAPVPVEVPAGTPPAGQMMAPADQGGSGG